MQLIKVCNDWNVCECVHYMQMCKWVCVNSNGKQIENGKQNMDVVAQCPCSWYLVTHVHIRMQMWL